VHVSRHGALPERPHVVANDGEEAVDALVVSPRTAAVLMTHSLDDDARVLALLSRRQLSYLGALGPGASGPSVADTRRRRMSGRTVTPVAMKVHAQLVWILATDPPPASPSRRLLNSSRG